MEASGGYERDWAKALHEAGIEVRIVDPKRVRSFARSAGRLAKNDAIDAEMIAWFAETFGEVAGPGRRCQLAKSLYQIVQCAAGSDSTCKPSLAKQRRARCTGGGAKSARARLLKKMARRACQARGRDREP